MKHKQTVIVVLIIFVAVALLNYRITPDLPAIFSCATDMMEEAGSSDNLCTLRSTANNKGLSKGRSIFVLHVGPTKTGTSYLQSVLATKLEQLRQDNFVYIGNNNGILNHDQVFECKNHRHMINTTNLHQGADCNVSEDFERLLQAAHKAGLNLIGSTEYFQHLNEGRQNALRAALRKQDWFLKVVVSYRRLHEVVPSHYNQHYKVKRRHGKPVGKHTDWPGINGDYAIPSFSHFFMESYQEDGHWQEANLPTRDAYSVWADAADDISIFPLHQEGDMPTNFVCQMITGSGAAANHTCHDMLIKLTAPKQLQTDDKQQPSFNENGSKELDYDILGVAAYELGWIHESHSRKNVAMTIAERHIRMQEKTGKDMLPQRCLEQSMLEMLCEKSLEEEKKWSMMFSARPTGQTFSSDELAAFNASWDTAVNDGKFCSVDVDKTLALPHWRNWIRKEYKTKCETKCS